METATTLGCGHANDWGWGAWSGPARDDAGLTYCRACAYQRELNELRGARRFFAYLGSDNATITTWPGGKVAAVEGPIRKHPWRGMRNGLWTFRARDVHGKEWSCRHYPNAGNYVRMQLVENPKQRRRHL